MAKKTEDLIDLMADLRRRDAEFCVVTVVRTQDATSAKAGAKALVTGDGEIHGHVGGSCVTGATRLILGIRAPDSTGFPGTTSTSRRRMC